MTVTSDLANFCPVNPLNPSETLPCSVYTVYINAAPLLVNCWVNQAGSLPLAWDILFNGYLDELWIFNGPLSSSQIITLNNTNYPICVTNDPSYCGQNLANYQFENEESLLVDNGAFGIFSGTFQGPDSSAMYPKVTSQSGQFGAGSLDISLGVNEFVMLPATLNLANSIIMPFTVSAYIYPAEFQYDMVIFSSWVTKYDDGVDDDLGDPHFPGFALYIENNQLTFTWMSSDLLPYTLQGGSVSSTNTWYFVGVTVQPNYGPTGNLLVTLYLNNAFVTRQTTGSQWGNSDNPPVYLVGVPLNVDGYDNDVFLGLIDALWIFNAALDNSEMGSLYNNNYPGQLPATSILNPTTCYYSAANMAKFFYYFDAADYPTNYGTVASNILSLNVSDAITEELFWQGVVSASFFDLSLVPDCFPYPFLPSDASNGVALFNVINSTLLQWYTSGHLELFQPYLSSSDPQEAMLVSRLASLVQMRDSVATDFHDDVIALFSFLSIDNTNTLTAIADMYFQAEIDTLWDAIDKMQEDEKKEAIIKLVLDVMGVGLALGGALVDEAFEGIFTVVASLVTLAGDASSFGFGGDTANPGSTANTGISFSTYGSGAGGGLYSIVASSSYLFSSSSSGQQLPTIEISDLYIALNSIQGSYMGNADAYAKSVISNYGYLRVFNLLAVLSSSFVSSPNAAATPTTSALSNMLSQQAQMWEREILLLTWHSVFNISFNTTDSPRNSCTVSKPNSEFKPYEDPEWIPLQQAFGEVSRTERNTSTKCMLLVFLTHASVLSVCFPPQAFGQNFMLAWPPINGVYPYPNCSKAIYDSLVNNSLVPAAAFLGLGTDQFFSFLGTDLQSE